GNEYEATYPKRAKGLVKNGRARFVNENTICLACPPENIMEDKIMENKEIIIDETTGEVTETEKSVLYTLDYALGQLEEVRANSLGFAAEVRETLASLNYDGPGDIGAQAGAQALEALIKEQFETYNKLIDFYTDMIADLKKEREETAKDDRTQYMDFVKDCVGKSKNGLLPDFEKLWKVMNN
ncbi:MAG: hypothetical protein MJ096_04050, partial [Clostridia bacterium]|nr:hypothetical protein [Clostridia bacterium]